MRIFTLLILAVGLAGCRTQKAAAPPTDTPQPVKSASVPVESDPRPLLVCFGDSLTAGYGADPGASYPDFLQKDLDAQGLRYRVVNAGVSGNTSKDGVERVAAVVAMKPAVVVVEFGGNDGLRGIAPRLTRENLAAVVGTLKAAGIKVVLAGITLPPDYGADYIRDFTGNYASIGKQFSVPVLPFLLRDVFGVEGMMQADRTHATAAGNQIVARNVLPYVTPLLKKD